MSRWGEDRPGGGAENSVPDQLFLFPFSSSDTWLLPDDPADQSKGERESDYKSSSQRRTKGRRKDGWKEGKEKGKEPEKKAEEERVERGAAWHKAKPRHSEDKSPGVGVFLSHISTEIQKEGNSPGD